MHLNPVTFAPNGRKLLRSIKRLMAKKPGYVITVV